MKTNSFWRNCKSLLGGVKIVLLRLAREQKPLLLNVGTWINRTEPQPKPPDWTTGSGCFLGPAQGRRPEPDAHLARRGQLPVASEMPR